MRGDQSVPYTRFWELPTDFGWWLELFVGNRVKTSTEGGCSNYGKGRIECDTGIECQTSHCRFDRT